MAGEPVLIVDDNAQNLKLASVLLRMEGFEVRTAVDAEQALRELESFTPRLILMDIQLPGMDGLELTRRLKSDPDRRSIVVIALTAYAMKGDEQRVRAAGCDGYVSKPIDVNELPVLLREHLARSRGAAAIGGERR
jgi:two-component system cell cycle response regulator